MNAVFMGTPEFAVPSLDAAARETAISSVVTQPDREQGRGRKRQYSPVKTRALELGLPVWQPLAVKEASFFEQMRKERPDIIVVVAFGQKIPRQLLDLPTFGCINVHASLLPAYRGAAPVQRAIIDGCSETGVTTMYLTEAWDAGDIIHQRTVPVLPDDTGGTLHDRLMTAGAELLADTLTALAAGCAPRIPQDHDRATYAPKLTKADGALHWQEPAEQLERIIRAMDPWPGAYVSFRGEMLKIRRASVRPGQATPGTVVELDESGITVGTGRELLCLEEVQRPGARWISGRAAANGLRLQLGDGLDDGHF